METFKIHIWIYMYVSTHILESPSQKCFQFYIIVTCAHIQMIQSPDPDKTNWICHVAIAQPKSQLKSHFAEELTCDSCAIRLGLQFDEFVNSPKICCLPSLSKWKCAWVKGYKHKHTMTTWWRYLIQILTKPLDASGSTRLPITRRALQHFTFTRSHTFIHRWQRLPCKVSTSSSGAIQCFLFKAPRLYLWPAIHMTGTATGSNLGFRISLKNTLLWDRGKYRSTDLSISETTRSTSWAKAIKIQIGFIW